jgi:hypothetical protein
MSNQIVAVQQGQGNFLAITENDRRAAKALKMMLSYGKDLSDDNALALALYGKLHGLDALNQECFFLVRVNRDGARTELGCYPGIKGKRKKAKEQLVQAAGHASTYKMEYEQLDDAEIKAIGLGDPATIAIAVRATLRDDVSMGRYLIDLVSLSKSGFAKEEIEGIIGKPPKVIGYGVVKKTELAWAKIEPYKLGRKRSESDALNQRFDLPFAEAAEDIVPDLGDSDEPTVTVVEQPRIARKPAEILGELGFTDAVVTPAPPEPTPLEKARAMLTTKGVPFGELSVEQLEIIASKKFGQVEQWDAAQLILDNMASGDDWTLLYGLLEKADQAGLAFPELVEGATKQQVVDEIEKIKAALPKAIPDAHA